MTAWIVKGKSSRNKWDTMLVPGNEDEWETRRPPRDWGRGDPVFIWESSPARRVIAMAEIRSVQKRNEDGDAFFVLRYTSRRLENPIGIEALRADPIFQDASFLKSGASGTLYALSPAQERRLRYLLEEANPETQTSAFGLSPEIAQNVLPFIGQSIRRVHALAPAKWGVTPRTRGFRLNVGRIEVATIDANAWHIVVCGESVPSDLDTAEGYPSIPGSRTATGPKSDPASFLERMRGAHDQLLALAAEGSLNPAAKSGHRDWAVDELARLTAQRLPLPSHENSDGGLVADAVEIARGSEFVEGSVARVLVNRYERDRYARDACIKHYGAACAVCAMRFEEVYGPEMAGVIHVHHICPLHESAGERKVDPIRDLRPLCPNCHTAIHQTKPPRTIDELKAILCMPRARR